MEYSDETNATGDKVPAWWIKKGNSADSWDANHKKKQKVSPGRNSGRV
jgi:hypothetical protein